MKLIALMVAKNEDDIIGHCIDEATKWADHIIIMNNASSDNTENIIIEKAKKNSKVIYWGRYDGVFRDGLRNLLYLDNQELFSNNDWIVRLDADEIFIDDPRSFLSKAPEQVNFVMSASFQYYYTEKDHEKELKDPEYLSTPPQDRLKYYCCNWSEYRCAKLTNDMIWQLGLKMGGVDAWPRYNTKYVYSERIKLRHFKYRSLEQIQKRIDARLNVFNKTKIFGHEANHFNETRIYDSKTLHFDKGDNNLIYNYDKLPELIDPKDPVKTIVI